MPRVTKKDGEQRLIFTESIEESAEEIPIFGWKVSNGHAFFINPSKHAERARLRLPLSVGNETGDPTVTEGKYAKASRYQVSFFLTTVAGDVLLNREVDGTTLKTQGVEVDIPAEKGCDIRVIKIEYS